MIINRGESAAGGESEDGDREKSEGQVIWVSKNNTVCHLRMVRGGESRGCEERGVRR